MTVPAANPAPRPRSRTADHPTSGMRIGALIREVLASAFAQRVPTIMVAILVAAMCATTLTTVGRSAAAEAQVLTRLDSAGARYLKVRDAKDRGFITEAMVSLAAHISSVETAVGLTNAFDVVNGAIGAGGKKEPTWQVVGDISKVARLDSGRLPQPGEAIISHKAMAGLGLDGAAGFVSGTGAMVGLQFPVVGVYRALEPFEAVGNGVLVSARPGTVAKSLDVVITSAVMVPTTQQSVLALLSRNDPQDISTESPMTLAKLQHQVMGDLGQYGRGLMLLVLGAGALLTAVVVLADVLLRRKDLGRRRALGAPRWVIVSLVVGRAVVAGLAGAIVGTLVTVLVLARWGQGPIVGFALGTALLAVLVAACSAVPPAIAASYQDPVKVLRTP